MYPSSSSSSSHKSMPSSSSSSALFRYGSAPGSLLTNAVDSVFGSHRDFASFLGAASSSSAHPHRPPPHHQRAQQHPPSLLGQYFSSDTSSVTSESTCKVNASKDLAKVGGDSGLQRSFGFSELTVGGGGSSSSPPLVKQKSSPEGFLCYLADGNAFSIARGSGSSNGGHGESRLKSQLSFTRQDSLSRISETSEDMVDRDSQENGHPSRSHSYATTSFGLDSWENTGSIIFSAPPGKRAKNIDTDVYSFHPLETQFSFPQTTLEMATVDKLFHIPEDSVPWKIRAKRGFATHPRSIAERERRTRISGRLKKLQELVPNMDKQTSYSDMLDLAVQHIKTLQTQVQKLRQELENCTCGCGRSS